MKEFTLTRSRVDFVLILQISNMVMHRNLTDSTPFLAAKFKDEHKFGLPVSYLYKHHDKPPHIDDTIHDILNKIHNGTSLHLLWASRSFTPPNFFLNMTAMPLPIWMSALTQWARLVVSGHENKSPSTSV